MIDSLKHDLSLIIKEKVESEIEVKRISEIFKFLFWSLVPMCLFGFIILASLSSLNPIQEDIMGWLYVTLSLTIIGLLIIVGLVRHLKIKKNASLIKSISTQIMESILTKENNFLQEKKHREFAEFSKQIMIKNYRNNKILTENLEELSLNDIDQYLINGINLNKKIKEALKDIVIK